MLLHNQTKFPIEWTADGVTYKWEPYGAANVPQQYRDNLRSQGFPVDEIPVPPKTKVDAAAAAQRAEREASELGQMRNKLADAEARAAAGASAAEAAEGRASRAAEREADLLVKVESLETQLKIAQDAGVEYERLLKDANDRNELLQAELDKARGKKAKEAKKAGGDGAEPQGGAETQSATETK